ncbi:MAG: TlpA family protein disulfide reductase [Hyphomicrobiales bacterium]|nr:TlpA family protein disulfide reductase [Hyphomicrobiales bacterium]
MSKTKQDSAAKKSSPLTALIVMGVAALAGFGAVYVKYGPQGNGTSGSEVKDGATRTGKAPAGRRNATGLAAFSRGQMTTFVAKDAPVDLPALKFQDGAGGTRTLADWRGKVVLLNLWATWCAPCRKEMPTLDRLEGMLGGDDFALVAISIDKGGLDLPRSFLEKIKVKHLKLFNDPTAKLGLTLKAYGMPTTLLINRDGKEIGRLVGPAEWDSEDAVALIRAAIDEKS